MQLGCIITYNRQANKYATPHILNWLEIDAGRTDCTVTNFHKHNYILSIRLAIDIFVVVVCLMQLLAICYSVAVAAAAVAVDYIVYYKFCCCRWHYYCCCWSLCIFFALPILWHCHLLSLLSSLLSLIHLTFHYFSRDALPFVCVRVSVCVSHSNDGGSMRQYTAIAFNHHHYQLTSIKLENSIRMGMRPRVY